MLCTEIYVISQTSLKIAQNYPIYYFPLIKLELHEFNILNIYKRIFNHICKNPLNLLIDSRVGTKLLCIWFVLAPYIAKTNLQLQT